MNSAKLLSRLEGVHTIDSIMTKLGVSRATAYVYVSFLKKNNYVKVRMMSNKKRIYDISRRHQFGGESYVDIMNKYSPVKLSESEPYKIYGRAISLEETLIYAIKTKKLRFILASLSLFQHINNWKLLGELARKNHVERSVGILYDLARKFFKTRRMEGKFRNSILPSKDDKMVFMIDGLKSSYFKELETYWKVYLPFNKADMEDYDKK